MAYVFEVAVGSQWISNDKRVSLTERRASAFEVVGFEKILRIEYARVVPLFAEGLGHRQRLIALHRFKPNATGYVPFEDDRKEDDRKEVRK